MRVVVILGLILIMAGCGGVRRIKTDVYIPDLDISDYNDSYYVEGWKNLKEGNPKVALKNFEQSTIKDEKLYVGFGYTFLSQNKFKLAERNFKKALELNPENFLAQFGLATLYELLNRLDVAFSYYSKLLVNYPENARIKLRYEYIKSTKTEFYLKEADEYKMKSRSEEQINALEMAAKYSPEISDIRIRISDFYYNEAKYEKAAINYEKVLEKYPNKEDILIKLANVYKLMEKLDSAVIIYKKLLELKPGDIELTNKVNDLKIKFYESKMPVKFKNIFFKNGLIREDLAALIGHYFDRYLIEKPPMIITDIAASFAKEHIIKICAVGIMKTRPDHSFDRFSSVKRADLAVIINSLIKYIEGEGHSIKYTPLEQFIEPEDISPLHKNYTVIKFLLNSQILKLDSDNKFNPTADVSPDELLIPIRKILNSIE